MIIKKMVEMGKSRCILYFDELDKACSKHGQINEITSILIHLTDPNMNKTFQDRFFQGVEFPLDKVIMIFSYNDSSKVDPILLDRLKEIKISPYTMEDKINICNKHIIKEMADNVNLDNINIDQDIIRYLIDNYTNEAGVRDIKRKIEDIFLHLNIEKIYNKGDFKNKKTKLINLNKDKITEILKEPDLHKRYININSQVGIINGLYATSNGDGGITPIQIYPNMQYSKDKYEVRLTGKQGEVMKESVLTSLTTAIDWLKHSEYKDQLDELMNYHVKNGFHVHTPDGATPKDGPSAGCAFTCAFISRILNKPIKNNIAMTGEIELTGKISKIGGLEFKLQGAKKAGVNLVYIPVENKKDIEEIKKKYINLIDNNFNIILVNHISEIINEILI
jgi:ATP-dependent Lon protease